MRRIAVFCLWAASGWALDPDRALTQYQHRIWQTQQGLPPGAIRSLGQTSDGYIWLGMDRGLVRFDGVRFSTPGGLAATALANAHIRQIIEGPQSSLWIATNGAGLLRWQGEELTQFSTENGLPSNDVSCVLKDRTGSVWACTDRGLVRIADGRVRTFGEELSFHTACQAQDGTVWAGGRGAQLSLLDTRGAARQITLKTLPAFANVQVLLCARDGSVWVGSTEGLTHIQNGQEKTITTEVGLANDSVLALNEAEDSTLWIGTNDGFTRLRNGELQSFGPKEGLSQSSVFSIFQDHEGSLWVGTKRGLNQFLDRRAIPITTSEGLPSNDTGPILEDAEGTLWVGSLNAGLARYNGRRWHVINREGGLSSDSISALARGASGGLWVGSDSGLDLVVDDRVQRTYHPKDGLPAGSIRSLFLDREGTLWIGTVSGAAVLRDGRIQRLPGIAGKRAPVLAFAEDDRRIVYAGVQDVGVISYEEWTLREIPGSPLAIPNVDTIYSTGGVLWVGADGGGLTMLEDGRALTLTEDDGLYDDDIYAIAPDDHGRLWMACSKGIFSVNRADLEKFRTGALKQVPSSTYSPMDGLQTLEVRSGVQPAAWRMNDGHLCFSMIRGLIVLDPDQFNVKLPIPQVSIESVTVDGRRMSAANLRQMDPGSKNLAFTYTGLSFRSPQRITFRYILEGFDKHWTEANTRRQAFYTNLPPGNYRFRVTACNFDGTCNEVGASVSFLVPAPFYQRAWFLASCLMLMALAAVLAYRTRIEGIKRQFEAILGERSRIARELHDTLIQGFSGVTMQMQALAARLAAPEKRVLEEIIHDAAQCLTESRRSVADLRGRQTEGSGLAGTIERVAHQTAAVTGMKLKLHLDFVPPLIPAEVEYNVLRIAQEALANAAKHSEGRSIKLNLRYRRNELALSIADDGRGMSSGVGLDPFPGHYGLIGMRERALGIGAALTISSSPGGGTTVSVAVPLAAHQAVETAGAVGD